MQASRVLAQFPASRHIFLRDGKPYRAGEPFKQADLAGTLRRIEREGLKGSTRDVRQSSSRRKCRRTGGLITTADLAAYRAIEREPCAAATAATTS